MGDPRLGIGGNDPPLEEVLAEETAGLKERADDLVSAARDRATVTSGDDAGRATLLLAMMREHESAIDAARRARKAPFLISGRVIDRFFGQLAMPLAGACSELHARLDAYMRQKEAEIAAERLRLTEEAERQRRIAEAAEVETERRRAEDRAALAEIRAETVAAPVVVHSGYGPKAFGRRRLRVEITDLTLALKHALRIDRHRIQEAVQAIYDAQVARAGVRELPGANIVADTTTVVRR